MKTSFLLIGVLAAASALSSCRHACEYSSVRAGYYDYGTSSDNSRYGSAEPPYYDIHSYGSMPYSVTPYHGSSVYRRRYDAGSAAPLQTNAVAANRSHPVGTRNSANSSNTKIAAPAMVHTWDNRYLGVSHYPGTWGAPVTVTTQTSARTPPLPHCMSSSSTLVANHP